MNILTLLWRSSLFHKIGKMFIQMNRTSFTIPIRQCYIVVEEHHQLYFLFHRPVLMLKNTLPHHLPRIPIFPTFFVDIFSLFIQLGIALGCTGYSPQ